MQDNPRSRKAGEHRNGVTYRFPREQRLALFLLACILGVPILFQLVWYPRRIPSPQPPLVTVSIVGAVQKPGSYTIPQDKTLGYALDRAGGLLPWADVSMLQVSGSLSAKRIYVPMGRLLVNSATTEELELLPTIGPELARRIVAYRDSIGQYTQLEQLQQIKGIGPTRFGAIKDYLSITTSPGMTPPEP